MNINNQIAIREDTKIQTTIRKKAFISLLNTFCYVITGRFHFCRNRIGETVATGDGQEYTVFRQVIVDPKKGRAKEPGAILKIRFDFAHGSPKQNRLLSLIPIPLIAGSHGFRSKTWMLNKNNGGFQGVYEWDTSQDAEAYRKSFAVKLMTKRAVPGSISFQIIH